MSTGSRRETFPPKITDSYNGDFNEIKNNLNVLIEAMNEITGVAEQISTGNLTVQVRERSAQDKLMQALSTMLERLMEVEANVQASTEQVSTSSQEMSVKTEQISQGATEQAASAEEVSSSMEQMNSNIMQNADNAQQTEEDRPSRPPRMPARGASPFPKRSMR